MATSKNTLTENWYGRPMLFPDMQEVPLVPGREIALYRGDDGIRCCNMQGGSLIHLASAQGALNPSWTKEMLFEKAHCLPQEYGGEVQNELHDVAAARIDTRRNDEGTVDVGHTDSGRRPCRQRTTPADNAWQSRKQTNISKWRARATGGSNTISCTSPRWHVSFSLRDQAGLFKSQESVREAKLTRDYLGLTKPVSHFGWV